MNNYIAPEIKIVLFDNAEILTASVEPDTTEYKGGNVELPDHDWD